MSLPTYLRTGPFTHGHGSSLASYGRLSAVLPANRGYLLICDSYLDASESLFARRCTVDPDWRREDRVRGRGAIASRADERVRYTFDSDNNVVEVSLDTEFIPGGGRGAKK